MKLHHQEPAAPRIADATLPRADQLVGPSVVQGLTCVARPVGPCWVEWVPPSQNTPGTASMNTATPMVTQYRIFITLISMPCPVSGTPGAVVVHQHVGLTANS